MKALISVLFLAGACALVECGRFDNSSSVKQNSGSDTLIDGSDSLKPNGDTSDFSPMRVNDYWRFQGRHIAGAGGVGGEHIEDSLLITISISSKTKESKGWRYKISRRDSLYARTRKYVRTSSGFQNIQYKDSIFSKEYVIHDSGNIIEDGKDMHFYRHKYNGDTIVPRNILIDDEVHLSVKITESDGYNYNNRMYSEGIGLMQMDSGYCVCTNTGQRDFVVISLIEYSGRIFSGKYLSLP